MKTPLADEAGGKKLQAKHTIRLKQTKGDGN